MIRQLKQKKFLCNVTCMLGIALITFIANNIFIISKIAFKAQFRILVIAR